MQLKSSRRIAIATLLLLTCPAPALAYMGPGIGLGVAGTALGVVVSVLLVLFAIVWYPLKRLIRRLRGRSAAARAISRAHEAHDERPL